MAKLLLVEDNRDLASTLADGLRDDRHVVEVAHDGVEGLHLMTSDEFDVIILDWDLPLKSGVELLREFREMKKMTPVIMLTGKNKIDEKEEGLDSGADDYLTKPFDLRELKARIRGLIRRASGVPENTLKIGDLVLDPIKYSLTKAGKKVHVTPKDFALLEFFMRNPDQVFSVQTILTRVWSYDSDASAEGLRAAVRRLRKAIDETDDAENSVLENVARVGYRLRTPD